MAHDGELRSLLDAAGVSWRPLVEAERAEAEAQWRAVYGRAFRGRPRLRQGSRADYEYVHQPAGRWLVVPLTSGVEGTPVSPLGLSLAGYECDGPVVALGALCGSEFAVSPTDLSWAMLYTHEDHALGGPYFVRREWLPGQYAERVAEAVRERLAACASQEYLAARAARGSREAFDRVLDKAADTPPVPGDEW